MSPERKSPGSWSYQMGDEHGAVTLMEYVAGCIARQNALLVRIMEALEHMEGMQGAADQFKADVAAMQGMPYAASQEVREALALYRGQKRQETIKQLEAGRGEARSV